MIAWALHQPHAGLSLAGAEDLLTAAERRYFSRLRVAKRRSEYLHGRYVTKCLVRAFLSGSGPLIHVGEVSVERDADGVPRVRILGQPNATLLSASLSHRHGAALAAVCVAELGTVGADLERIEPRSPRLVDDFFTATEIRQVDRASRLARDTLICGIWSAKEAILKALHLGLSVDTRRVECRLPALDGCWRPVACRVFLQAPVRIRCWARRSGNFVLTLAAAFAAVDGLVPEESPAWSEDAQLSRAPAAHDADHAAGAMPRATAVQSKRVSHDGVPRVGRLC
jgi:4'-phosphopantetheinyl transferase